MKKLNITKEQYSGSEYQKKYGNLKFVSESRRGNLYKTDKGRILKFVTEAREYVDDNSIEADSAKVTRRTTRIIAIFFICVSPIVFKCKENTHFEIRNWD